MLASGIDLAGTVKSGSDSVSHRNTLLISLSLRKLEQAFSNLKMKKKAGRTVGIP